MLNDSRVVTNPSLPANSVRKASQIVESTQNFMQVLESCTKNEVPAPFYHQRRGGIKVQDLLNRFKSEQKYKDKSKSKSKSKKKERSK